MTSEHNFVRHENQLEQINLVIRRELGIDKMFVGQHD